MILDLFTRCILISLLAFGGGGQRCRLSKGSWWRRPAGSVRRISPRRSPSATSRLVRAHYRHVSGLSDGWPCWGVRGDVWHFPDAVGAGSLRGASTPAVDAASAVVPLCRGAAPAVVGLLVVTALHLGRSALASGIHVGIAGVALGLALWTKLHPLVLLLGGAVIMPRADEGWRRCTAHQQWWVVAMRGCQRLRQWARTIKRDVPMLSLAVHDPACPGTPRSWRPVSPRMR